MNKPVRLSEDDLSQVMQMNFHLLAETLAELVERNPDKRIVKMRTEVNGFEVSCAVMAEPLKKGE